MPTTPECAGQAPLTEDDTSKESSPPQQCVVNIGQGGPGGGGDDDEEEAEVCRICYEGAAAGALVTLCRCKGSMGFTHLRCLERWLDAAQKTRCELCGFAYHVQLTKRYAALPSVCVWAREHTDTRLLVIDLLTVLFITPVIGAYVYLSVRGIIDLSKGPTGASQTETATEGLTAIGLMVLCLIIVTCYIIWICVTFNGLFNDWYAWWSTCYRIRVLETPPEEGQRQPVREEPVWRRDSSLELIFSRGVFVRRQATV